MITFVIHASDQFGGVERRYARLAVFLYSLNIDVRICCTADAFSILRDYLSFSDFNNFFIYDKNSDGNWFKSKLNRIIGLFNLFIELNRDKSQKVHLSMNPNLVSAIYSIFDFLLPPYSISFVDPTFNHVGSKSLINRIIYFISLKSASKVDCLSPNLYAVLSNFYPQFSYLFVTAPCSFFQLHSDFSILERDIDVLFLGRFSFEKGLDILELAFAKIQSISQLNIDLHVCGVGSISPKIFNARVYYSSDTYSLLKRSKIFLSIQKYENYPSQSLLEAMSSGCAIIATDVGETRLLLDDESAILINYDSDELVNAIITLISNPNLCHRLGMNAINRANSHTVERYGKYFLGSIVN